MFFFFCNHTIKLKDEKIKSINVKPKVKGNIDKKKYSVKENTMKTPSM